MIRRAVVEKIKDGGAKGDIDVGFDNKAIEINLPADQSANFTLNNFDYDALTKRFRAELMTETGQTPLQVPLAGRVLIKFRVPVLARRLEGGTVIGAADLDWMSISDERVGEAVVTDADQLIGHELRRTTADGEILHVSDIIPPRLVTRGSIVTLKIESPFMTLTAQGKCLQDGTRGETVRVINTQSNRTIEGIVQATGVVLVPIAQKLADAQ
jgi:flagellar basal body P-ring formation protein FlgA